MAVVLPHGALFRMGAEGKIRRKILEMDMLEAVIGLGPNLFYGTGLAACIMVFRRSKPEATASSVLFIDASREFKKGRQQNELLAEHVERMRKWYTHYRDVAGACKVVTLDDIRANDFNLNIPRYVEPVVAEETVTVAQAVPTSRPASMPPTRPRTDSRTCSRRGAALMFFVGDTLAGRHNEISRRFINSKDVMIAVFLAAADFEWTVRRAIIALGHGANRQIREGFAGATASRNTRMRGSRKSGPAARNT